ncbi:MAG: His/Gly/Thr/Pro-type tRNA ligase C-terminal domain-containing protein, partial [Balneolaceae bacterium]
EKHRPVIIHRAPFGSMERFISILIEHFAGDFPLWLAPCQIRILPISDDFTTYANQCLKQLNSAGLRAEIDQRSEKIGARIRDAETAKIPYMFIVGGKEQSQNKVSVRRHKKGDIGTFPFSEFISDVQKEVANKTLPPDHNN